MCLVGRDLSPVRVTDKTFSSFAGKKSVNRPLIERRTNSLNCHVEEDAPPTRDLLPSKFHGIGVTASTELPLFFLIVIEKDEEATAQPLTLHSSLKTFSQIRIVQRSICLFNRSEIWASSISMTHRLTAHCTATQKLKSTAAFQRAPALSKNEWKQHWHVQPSDWQIEPTINWQKNTFHRHNTRKSLSPKSMKFDLANSS